MKVERPMFWAGIAAVVIAAILLAGGFRGDSAIPPLLGLLGIIMIGADRRPLKRKRK